MRVTILMGDHEWFHTIMYTMLLQRMGVPVSESLEGAAAVGDVGEGGDKDGGNGEVTGRDVQSSHEVGVIIWQQDLGGDGGHTKNTISIP